MDTAIEAQEAGDYRTAEKKARTAWMFDAYHQAPDVIAAITRAMRRAASSAGSRKGMR